MSVTLKPIAMVDVDETLWAFNTAVHATSKELGVRVPPPSECNSWTSIYSLSGKEAVDKVFDTVHSRQCSYAPFPDAQDFLTNMRKRFNVAIVSHRSDRYKPELIEWLHANNLQFDGVVLTPDKIPMVNDSRVKIVVDDRAETIAAAIVAGKVGVGLRRPWNQTYRAVKLPLFESLTEIWEFIENWNDIYKFSNITV